MSRERRDLSRPLLRVAAAAGAATISASAPAMTAPHADRRANVRSRGHDESLQHPTSPVCATYMLFLRTRCTKAPLSMALFLRLRTDMVLQPSTPAVSSRPT